MQCNLIKLLKNSLRNPNKIKNLKKIKREKFCKLICNRISSLNQEGNLIKIMIAMGIVMGLKILVLVHKIVEIKSLGSYYHLVTLISKGA